MIPTANCRRDPDTPRPRRQMAAAHACLPACSGVDRITEARCGHHVHDMSLPLSALHFHCACMCVRVGVYVCECHIALLCADAAPRAAGRTWCARAVNQLLMLQCHTHAHARIQYIARTLTPHARDCMFVHTSRSLRADPSRDPRRSWVGPSL